MKKLYLLFLIGLAFYVATSSGCGKSLGGTAPLYTITASTYTENKVDYLKITLTYLNEDVYEPGIYITDPDNNTTEHQYYSSSSGDRLPSFEPWSIEGIVKITGNWHFKVDGFKALGNTAYFESEKDLTVN